VKNLKLIFAITFIIMSQAFAVVPDSIANKPFVVPGGSMTQSSGSTVRVFGTGTGSNVSFQFPLGTNMNVWAGTLAGELNGIAAKFYCIDISHNLATYSVSSPNEYTDNGSTNQYISYILNNYAPFTGAPTANEAAAIQIAIWHFSDGVDASTVTNATIKNRALAIIADANANSNSGSILSTLLFNPTSQSLPMGQSAVFNLTGYNASFLTMQGVNVDFGASSGSLNFTSAVTDATGTISGVTLSQGVSNNATITATAHHIIPQGTRYVHKVSPNQYQKIVLATPINTTVTSSATITWVATADLSITKTSSSNSGNHGEIITFTITVTNHGPNGATNVVVTDQIPTGLDFNSYSASQGTYNNTTGVWTVGSLANGGTATLQMTTTVNLQSLNSNFFTLGEAVGYNLFVLNDVFQPSSDTEGKVAVGHNAYFAGYSVGDKLSYPSGTEDVLIVGNDLTYVSGAVYNGNVVYGNSSNLPINAVSINNGTVRQGSVIDFNAASTHLLNLSNSLSNYPANGTVTFQWGGLELTGTHPLLNVFNVDGAQLSQANNMAISVPNGSVVLVNISGTTVSWRGGLTVTGTSISNVLYNFPDATNITIQGIDVRGTVLAPKADMNFVTGVINGQMICKNFTGQGQMNNTSFVGNIPVDEDVVNVAEITHSDQYDPDSTPNNGITIEDDYASVMINLFNYTGGSGGSGGGSGSGTGNWTSQGQFMSNEFIWAMTNNNSGDLLIGTIGGKIYQQTTTGFERINTSMTVGYVWSLAVDASGTIYAGTEQGLYKTVNGGTTWTLTSLAGKDVRAVKIDPQGNLYAGTWGFGVLKSTDNGSSWTTLNTGILNTAIHALAIDGSGNIYAGSFGGGIIKSINGGNDWTDLNAGFPYIWALTVAPNGNIYAGTYGAGVLKSANNGTTWTNTNVGQAFIYGVTTDASNNVYAASWANGIFGSSDNGANWLNLGLSGLGAGAVFSTPTSSIVWAGTENGTLYSLNSPMSVETVGSSVPVEFNLSQNYPNPFNPSTVIRFAIPAENLVTLNIYSITGELVASLLNEVKTAGEYEVSFDATSLPTGVYIYKINAGSFSSVKKMMLVK